VKNQAYVLSVERKKVVSIMILLVISIVIVFLGPSFSVFSVVKNISFNVLNSRIHGTIFGLAVMFLGVRYYLSVQKLKVEVYKKTSKFSWSNFKRKKISKSMSKNR